MESFLFQDAGVPTGSTADQEELGEPHFNHIHTTDPNDVQEEHRNVSIDNAPTLNNSTTSNGNIIMNPSDERDLVPNPNQPEFIITSPKGDDNSGQQGSNLMMAVLKPDNESSVEMDSFDRSECSERAPLDSGLNTMEDSRYTGHPNFQQPDHQDIEEDGDDDAVENDSLLSVSVIHVMLIVDIFN